MDSRDFQSRLSERAHAAGVKVLPDLAIRLETYFRLLERWNQKINLTGFELADPTSQALDCLLIEPLVAAQFASTDLPMAMLDIGSGGGSPAIPMALALQVRRLLMVESRSRKAGFLREALRAVDFHQGEVAAVRYETLLDRSDLSRVFDLTTVRAVRVEPQAVVRLRGLLKPTGSLFLFRSSDELEPMSLGAAPFSSVNTVPLLDSLGSQLVVCTG